MAPEMISRNGLKVAKACEYEMETRQPTTAQDDRYHTSRTTYSNEGAPILSASLLDLLLLLLNATELWCNEKMKMPT